MAFGYDFEGEAAFGSYKTWYGGAGDLERARSGSGPAPLVVLHGGPGATHDYLLPLARLAEERAVVFYDQLGNGRSTHLRQAAADFWTVDLFLRQLDNLLAQLDIGGRYHLLGQSWGGFLAQEHALTKPPGLGALVLSNTAASFPDFVAEADKLRAELPPEVEATLRRHEAAGSTDDPAYAEACAVFYERHLCRLPQPWPEEVVASFAALEEDPTVYHATNGPSEFHVIGTFKEWSSKDRLHRIGAPTLVVSGRYDEATPLLQEELVRGIAGAEQVIVEDASHLSMWEQPTTYLDAISSFLGRHD